MDISPVVDFKDVPRTQRPFTIESQSLEFEIDFQRQKINGRTEIQVQPHSREARTFQFNCRQCTVKSASVDGKLANFTYEDPYSRLTPRPNFTVHQHHLLKSRVDKRLAGVEPPELTITLPSKLTIKESEQYKALKKEVSDLDLSEVSNTAGRYAGITITIEFETTGLRDGLQWVGCAPGDTRWSHVYTRNSPFPGSACCLFPCVDDIHSRNPWRISINSPRTLGDAFRRKDTSEPSAGTEAHSLVNGIAADDDDDEWMPDALDEVDEMGLTEADKELEITIVTSGELTGEIIDPNDSHRKIHTFSIPSAVSANQIGFTVGPFEDVDLSEFREVDDDERLGEAAIRVHGFCLPGRAAEVRNACMPMAKAIDFFTTTFTTYTGESFKICFVEDLKEDTIDTAGLTICSTRLLFPAEVIDLLTPVTRALVFALASQWAGIHLVPREQADSWAIAGMATFMTDTFLRTLMGKNEYRFQAKINADKVYEQDLNRPSLYGLGNILDLDPDERRFMTLKAGVVFFILDQRFLKVSGTSGMVRVVARLLNNAKSEEADSSFLSTEKFKHQCTRSSHQKLETFFDQWVHKAGCPRFQVLQEMNKKKLQILMTFTQTHVERTQERRDLEPSDFLRESKEDAKAVWAGTVPTAFVGPMTISIHEADGTPYEHTVEITGQHWVTQIPYNTKYKRMKRGRRQRERKIAGGDDAQEEVLLYSLGDVLQGEDDVAEWKLSDWDPEMEQKMGEESYEWIRTDADFEWICSMSIKMPAYMWMSQLQQDKDVVAQMESLQWVSYETKKGPHPLISTYLLRTLLDKRYFHGIRTMAAERLPNCAKAEVDWIGLYHLQKAFQELFCVSPDSPIPRPNEFSSRHSYIVQCAILRGLADIKDNNGRTPAQVKKFFMDKLKFNDNSSNDYDDTFYVSKLLSCLTKTLLGPPAVEEDEGVADDFVLRREAVAEVQRYKRINEWTPSFQNVFTITALDCLVKLGKADVVKPNYKEFLRYTQADHSDQVRIKAFDCLIDLDMHKKDSIMTYLLHELSTDPSPYVRENLFCIFGKAIGKIAIGDKVEEKPLQPSGRGLVIEEESTNIATNTRAMLERRQTIPGAVAALKKEIGENERLKEAMWAAVKSPILSIREVSNLLHLCSLSFEEKDGLHLTFKLPRHWTCAREHPETAPGEEPPCWVVFRKNGSFRTAPAPKVVPGEKKESAVQSLKLNVPRLPNTPAPRPPPPAAPVRRVSHTIPRKPSATPIPPPTPGPVHLTNIHTSAVETQKADRPRLIVKLKTGGLTPITLSSPAFLTPNGTFTTPLAPYGFGTIMSSPAPAAAASPPDLTSAMSPPPRPASAASTKRRQSSGTPAPVLFGAINNAATEAVSPLGFGPVSNTPQHSPAITTNGIGGRKRKSETPAESVPISSKRRKSTTAASMEGEVLAIVGGGGKKRKSETPAASLAVDERPALKKRKSETPKMTRDEVPAVKTEPNEMSEPPPVKKTIIKLRLSNFGQTKQ